MLRVKRTQCLKDVVSVSREYRKLDFKVLSEAYVQLHLQQASKGPFKFRSVKHFQLKFLLSFFVLSLVTKLTVL